MAYAVITRDPEASAPYAVALAALGLETIAMPVTRTEAIESGLDRVVRERTYDAIVVASARAARALVEAWNAPPRSSGRVVVSSWYEQMYGEPRDPLPAEVDPGGRAMLPPIWVVGPATARVLEDAGLRCLAPKDVDDGKTLAAAVIDGLGGDAEPPLRGRRVLVPRAADGRRELLEAMVDAGAVVDAISVYKTFHAEPADATIADGKRELEGGDVACCCVFAPSQAQALAELVPLGAIALFIAIGDTTAAALRAAGAKRVVIADEPTPEGLARAVSAVYPPKP